jgi:hypothetical protein
VPARPKATRRRTAAVNRMRGRVGGRRQRKSRELTCTNFTWTFRSQKTSRKSLLITGYADHTTWPIIRLAAQHREAPARAGWPAMSDSMILGTGGSSVPGRQARYSVSDAEKTHPAEAGCGAPLQDRAGGGRVGDRAAGLGQVRVSNELRKQPQRPPSQRRWPCRIGRLLVHSLG